VIKYALLECRKDDLRFEIGSISYISNEKPRGIGYAFKDVGKRTPLVNRRKLLAIRRNSLLESKS